MMWKKHTLPIATSSFDSEPFELQRLKYMLAHISCNCNECNSKMRQPSFSSVAYHKHFKNQGVQAEYLNPSVDRFTEPKLQQIIYLQNSSTDTNFFPIDKPNHVSFCPNCLLTINLLHGAQQFARPKVVKDEESEIKPQLFHCDKAVNESKVTIEKTTSFSLNSSMKSSDSNLSLSGFATDYTMDLSSKGTGTDSLPHGRKLEVTFKDELVESNSEIHTPLLYGNCACLETFIDTIRPPLPLNNYN